ncbi:MAG: hypothetical protein D6681_15140 [Calditrichaeota bacterium]|nr:MAG: hypothetical protein D6681_15140 [Calditrichota bacterium]
MPDTKIETEGMGVPSASEAACQKKKTGIQDTENDTNVEPEFNLVPIPADVLIAGPPPPPVDFVIGGLPIRRVGLLLGSDGAGKSWLTLQFALSVAAGIPVAGGAIPAPKQTGSVLVIVGEDDRNNYCNRLLRILDGLPDEQRKLAGVRLNQLEILCLEGERMPLARVRDSMVVPHFDTVKKLKKFMKDKRLVVLDPLVMFHDLDENSNSHMDFLGRLFDRMARETGAAILLVHHTGQDAVRNGREDHHVGRGGTALACACRAVWVLRALSEKEAKGKENPHKYRKLAGPKVTHGPRREAKLLEHDGRILCFVDGPGVVVDKNSDDSERMPERTRTTSQSPTSSLLDDQELLARAGF